MGCCNVSHIKEDRSLDHDMKELAVVGDALSKIDLAVASIKQTITSEDPGLMAWDASCAFSRASTMKKLDCT